MKKNTNKLTKVDTNIIRASIKELEDGKHIEKADALKRLRENEDFKMLFEEEFFKEYPLRCARLKNDPSITMSEQAEQHLKRFDSIINASGLVQVWLKQLEGEGNRAVERIDELKTELANRMKGK